MLRSSSVCLVRSLLKFRGQRFSNVYHDVHACCSSAVPEDSSETFGTMAPGQFEESKKERRQFPTESVPKGNFKARNGTTPVRNVQDYNQTGYETRRRPKSQIGWNKDDNRQRGTGANRTYRQQDESGRRRNRTPVSRSRDKEDTFGSLYKESPSTGSLEQRFELHALGRPRVHEWRTAEDMEDEDDVAEFRPSGKIHNPEWYQRKCELLGKEDRLAECVAMLEKRMIGEDKVPPRIHNFNVVLHALAKHGHFRKAFELYKQLRTLGLIPTSGTYSALWNSCANSAEGEEALKRAEGLLRRLDDQFFPLRQVHYHILIKVYGRQGDLEAAFRIMDRMIAAHIIPSPETYAHLLMGCIQDKDAGLTLAIQVWRRMLQEGVHPSVHNFSLLLLACKQCGLGPPELANQLLIGKSRVSQNSLEHTSVKELAEPSHPLLNDPDMDTHSCQQKSDSPVEIGNDPTTTTMTHSASSIVNGNNHSNNNNNNNKSVSVVDSLETTSVAFDSSEITVTEPHLTPKPTSFLYKNYILNPKFEPHSDSFADLSLVVKPAERFALLGGQRAVLALMKKNQVQPSIKIFTEFLDLIPDTEESEEKLLEAMEESGCSADVDFHNLLIRKKCKRGEIQQALKQLTVISQKGLTPNQMTFGCLAIGCRKRVDGIKLLEAMEQLDIDNNIVIMTSLMKNAVDTINFVYAIQLLKILRKEKIKPNVFFLRLIEAKLGNIAKRIGIISSSGSERRISEDVFEYLRSEKFTRHLKAFKAEYREWLKVVEVAEETPPWKELDRAIHSISADDLRERWEKPWENRRPVKYS